MFKRTKEEKQNIHEMEFGSKSSYISEKNRKKAEKVLKKTDRKLKRMNLR